MRVALLFSLLATSVGYSQTGDFSFCATGIRPDGYINWKSMPPPNGHNAVVATVPVTGLAELTATVYVAASSDGYGGYYVSNANQVQFPATAADYPVIIAFSQPIQGFSVNVRTAGRFGHDVEMLINDSDGGVISQNPAQAKLDSAGFDYPYAQIAVSPFQVVSRSRNITSVAIHQLPAGETYGFELLNFRIQSGAAADPGSMVVSQDGLLAWYRADVALNAAALYGYGPQQITSWPDSSGGGSVATGKGGVALDGSGCQPVVQGVFQVPLSIDGLTGMTVIMATNTYDDPGGSNNAAVFWGETSSWGLSFFSPSQTGVFWRFGTGQVGNNPWHTRTSSIAADFTVSSFLHNGSGEYLYINGLVAAQSTGRRSEISGSDSTMWVGASYGGQQPFPGGIGEVIIFRRALSEVERLRIEMYLMQKFGVRQ